MIREMRQQIEVENEPAGETRLPRADAADESHAVDVRVRGHAAATTKPGTTKTRPCKAGDELTRGRAATSCASIVTAACAADLFRPARRQLLRSDACCSESSRRSVRSRVSTTDAW